VNEDVGATLLQGAAEVDQLDKRLGTPLPTAWITVRIMVFPTALLGCR
jgi:hypothetical protein